MIVPISILAMVAAGLVAWGSARRSRLLPRRIAMATMLAELALISGVAIRGATQESDPGQALFASARIPWIPRFGIELSFAMDGLSLVLVLLTLVLGLLAIGAAWSEIMDKPGFFYLNLMLVLAGLIAVFTARDLVLFYFSWELAIIPMYFLITIYGKQRRLYAGTKFFLFTQAGSLCVLIAIVSLALIHERASGELTFDAARLLSTDLTTEQATWIMSGLFIGFAVKLPAVPFHPWLPDAHTEAPTAGSVILAGLLLKTGAYGLLRFALPLAPQAPPAFAIVAMTLGAAGILYGAILAFAQTDLKRLVAYTSVSHMGFVLLGIFSQDRLALDGVVLQIVCHALSTGGLFVLVGALEQRVHTRDLAHLGGLWTQVPRMGAVALLLALASLGLPGLGNFIAEFLILFGAFERSAPITIIAACGLVGATIYALRLLQRTFHGEPLPAFGLTDLGPRELSLFAGTILALLWLGLHPQPILETTKGVLAGLSIEDTSRPPARGERAQR